MKSIKGDRRSNVELRSVLLVENTGDGELARRIREVIQRLTPSLGFCVKVVERTGATLQSKFTRKSLLNKNLWEM